MVCVDRIETNLKQPINGAVVGVDHVEGVNEGWMDGKPRSDELRGGDRDGVRGTMIAEEYVDRSIDTTAME